MTEIPVLTDEQIKDDIGDCVVTYTQVQTDLEARKCT